jgi:hypothetical protein
VTTTPPPHPAAAAAAANPAPPWHLAGALAALKAGVDAHWPGRDKRSDGGIGDARHQAEGSASDHNPWLSSSKGPAVRAYDFTVTQPGILGVDGPWLAECLRLAGAGGDNRLAGKSGDVNDNGYVIFNHHITAPDFSRWVPYTGEDAHTTHVHVSATRDPAGFEDGRPWSFLTQQPEHPTPPAGLPHLDPIHPQPAGHSVPSAGPHDGNSAQHAPAPVADVDGPEGAGYAPMGADATGTGPGFRAQYGNRGPNVERLQAELNRTYPDYSNLKEDGDYGNETAGVIEDFARRVAEDPHCPSEHRAALAAANGDNIGPHLAAVFGLYGINV